MTLCLPLQGPACGVVGVSADMLQAWLTQVSGQRSGRQRTLVDLRGLTFVQHRDRGSLLARKILWEFMFHFLFGLDKNIGTAHVEKILS